eukprot:3097780-Rhodomonas_salina.2
MPVSSLTSAYLIRTRVPTYAYRDTHTSATSEIEQKWEDALYEARDQGGGARGTSPYGPMYSLVLRYAATHLSGTYVGYAATRRRHVGP